MSAGIARGPARALTAAALTGAALLLGGCGLFHRDAARVCVEPPAVQSARNQQPLRVPAGLRAPDTSKAIKIPDLQAQRSPGAGARACLFEPPTYRPSSAVAARAPRRAAARPDPKDATAH